MKRNKPLIRKTGLKPRPKTSQDLEYERLRDEFMGREENHLCAACAILRPRQPVNVATDLHHKAGRGPYYLVVETWMPVCRPCHEIIHNVQTLAMSAELSLLKMSRYSSPHLNQ